MPTNQYNLSNLKSNNEMTMCMDKYKQTPTPYDIKGEKKLRAYL